MGAHRHPPPPHTSNINDRRTHLDELPCALVPGVAGEGKRAPVDAEGVPGPDVPSHVQGGLMLVCGVWWIVEGGGREGCVRRKDGSGGREGDRKVWDPSISPKQTHPTHTHLRGEFSPHTPHPPTPHTTLYAPSTSPQATRLPSTCGSMCRHPHTSPHRHAMQGSHATYHPPVGRCAGPS